MDCTNSTKIDVFDSMNYTSTSWDKIKPNVIRYCFQKVAFYVWNFLEEAGSSPLENEDFQTLQNFPDYAMVDNDLVTSCTWTLDGMITDAMTMVNAKEENNEQQEENRQVEDDNIDTYCYCWLAILK